MPWLLAGEEITLRYAMALIGICRAPTQMFSLCIPWMTLSVAQNGVAVLYFGQWPTFRSHGYLRNTRPIRGGEVNPKGNLEAIPAAAPLSTPRDR
jgi:hypothetical protein